MFAGNPQEPQPVRAAPSFMTHIMNLLGLQPHHFQNHFNNFQENFQNAFNNYGNHHQQHQGPSHQVPPTPGFTPQYPNSCNCNCR